MELNTEIADSLFFILFLIFLYRIIKYDDSHFLYEIRMKAVYWQLVLLNGFFLVSVFSV